MRALLSLVLLVSGCALDSEVSEISKETCSGYDLLDWMTLDPDLRDSYHLEGTHNLYTSVWSDKLWWLKNSNGDTWDINLFDENGIYAWITETGWNTPANFKKATYNTNFKMGPRCVQGGQPGTYTTNSDTSYDTYNSCSYVSTSTVGRAIYEVWGPYSIDWGGSLGQLDTLVLSYRWGCDVNYDNCSTKEAYYLTQRYGLVSWESYTWQSGWTLTDQTVFNCLVPGGPSITWQC